MASGCRVALKMESVGGLGGYLGKWVNSILLWNEYKAGSDRKKNL